MKKIYFLLAMLVSFFGGTVSAQSQYDYEYDEDEPLITDVDQLRSPFTDASEGSLANMIDGTASNFWHSNWHNGNQPGGYHYFEVRLPEDFYDVYGDEAMILFVYTRRNNADNDHTTVWTVWGSNDDDPADPQNDKEDCEFIDTIRTPFTSKNDICISKPFLPDGAMYLRFYSEEETGASYGTRGYFHVGDFQLYVAIKRDEIEAAAAELEAICNKYIDYYDNYDYWPVGENPGDFSEELVDAFRTAWELADDASYNSDDVDEMKQLGLDLIAAYDTIWTSQVPLVLESGYYRFRTAMPYYEMEEDPETQIQEKVYRTKYLRAKLNGETNNIEAWWGTPDDLSVDASALWKVTRLENGKYDIYNVGYDMRIDTVHQSVTVTLSKEAYSEWNIKGVYTNEDGETLVNMTVMNDKTYDYLHQLDHHATDGEGNGSASKIVGWTSTFDLPTRVPGASDWIYEAVTAAEAEEVITNFEPYKNREAMLAAYDSIMSNAKTNLDKALDPIHVDLVTEASQLSSPCSDSSEGQHIEYLIDGDATTFWHTDWHGNYTGEFQGGLHYVQIQFAQPIGREVYLDVTRRNTDNDHPIQWVVFGGTDPEDLVDDNWEVVDTLETPYDGKGTIAKSVYFDPKNATVLRIAATNCQGASYGFRTYWHSAEIQIAYEEPNPNAQANTMGEVVPNLQKIIDEYKDIPHDDVTVDMYDNLKAAYDAFMAKFVNPTVLRDFLAEYKGVDEKVVLGTDPGYYKSDADAKAFKKLYDDAVAYDAAGVYSAQQSQDFIDQLTALAEKINDPNATNPVQVGKWYRLRFASESFYEDRGWDKLPGGETIEYVDALEGGDTVQIRTSPLLFGKIAAAARGENEKFTYLNTDSEEKEATRFSVVEAENDELGVGNNIYFINEEELENKDMGLFRFINVGDTAFIMQNKATGMFINAQRVAVLSAHPSIFTTEAAGYGLNYIHPRNLANGDQNFLHAQVQQNVLVHYNRNSDWDNKRCRFFLEEAGDVDPAYDGTNLNLPVIYGTVNTYCFPVEITPIESNDYKIWGLNGVKDNTLSLATVDKVIGGRPFIVIYGDPDTYIEEDENVEMITVKKGYEITREPQTTGILKGTYEGLKVTAGSLVAQGNKFTVVKAAGYDLGINKAYISTEEGFEKNAEIEIELTGEEDGIQTALANISKAGAVYTLDGRMVSKHANLNEISRFGKGTYILNGTKIIVK